MNSLKMNELKKTFKNKDILVTGGCGSIGSEIVRQLVSYDVRRIRIFDHDESGEFHLSEELKEYKSIRPLIGDIRDKDRLKRAIRGVDIVFHAAALKHVPLCEYNPFEAVRTNVFGTQNLINVAREEEIEKFLSISTDKAVNPINTMGATKLLSEKLVLNASLGEYKTLFSCVRLGNVLNSNGSVIPIFLRQIKEGGPVTVTSREMTRFFMSMPDAVNLVLKAVSEMKGREIFILKMKSIRIIDLASVMIEELAPKFGYKPEDIEIKIIGVRPGEKLYECLLSEEEAQHVEENGDMFILRPGILTPQFIGEEYGEAIGGEKYDSRKAEILSKDDIRKILYEEGIIID